MYGFILNTLQLKFKHKKVLAMYTNLKLDEKSWDISIFLVTFQYFQLHMKFFIEFNTVFIKVSKSQKHFFLKLHGQKTHKI